MRARRSPRPRQPNFYRSDAWSRLRRLIKVRDAFTCQACHIRSRLLVVHHRCPRRLFRGVGQTLHPQADHPRNLVTLCRGCHQKAHTGRLPRFLTRIVPTAAVSPRRPLH
jgi:5-methylcytosine-specific restriction endonuclease McrA